MIFLMIKTFFSKTFLRSAKVSFCTLMFSIFIPLLPFFSAFGEEIKNTEISKGDGAYAQHHFQEAREDYHKAFEKNPSNSEIAWKLSQTYSDMGEEKENAKNRKEDQEKAIFWARKSIELNPENSKGHLYLSIALGRSVQNEGPREKIRLSKEIKSEAEKAVTENPEEYLAWHILGCWNREMATLNWIERKFADLFLGGLPKDASLEKAEEYFLKAIAINPDVIAEHLELAKTYEALHLNEKASIEYQKVLALPLYDAQDQEHQEEARKQLKKLKKEA